MLQTLCVLFIKEEVLKTIKIKRLTIIHRSCSKNRNDFKMENTEKYSARVNTNELLAYQRGLKEEKEVLQNMLTKIDDQIHRLQVEQLHLLGLMNKSLKGTEQPLSHRSINEDDEDSTSKSLDLSVATAFKHFEEEMEDEDDI